MTRRLEGLIATRDDLADLDPAERRLALRDLLVADVPAADLAALVAEVANEIDGFGPLTELMDDDSVTDVLVNGPEEIWVERSGELEPTALSFAGSDALREFADRFLARAGVRVDVSNPIADGRLPDGSRIHVVLPPIAPDGPLVSIRRFPRRRLRLDDLVAAGTATRDQARRLAAAVADRETIAIGGGTGSGKTTLLGALLSLVDRRERIVVVEEVPELRSPGGHAVSLVARPPNHEGAGAVSLEVLVRAALRMRPDRIVVGEVRGAEALDALAGMATGHEGSMVTVHARSAADVVDRLVSLALRASSGASEAALASQARRSLDVIVYLERRRGARRVAAIEECR